MQKEVTLTPAKIKNLREKVLHMNKTEFAERIGVRRETVHTWELGTHEPKGAAAKALRELFAKTPGGKQ